MNYYVKPVGNMSSRQFHKCDSCRLQLQAMPNMTSTLHRQRSTTTSVQPASVSAQLHRGCAVSSNTAVSTNALMPSSSFITNPTSLPSTCVSNNAPVENNTTGHNILIHNSAGQQRRSNTVNESTAPTMSLPEHRFHMKLKHHSFLHLFSMLVSAVCFSFFLAFMTQGLGLQQSTGLFLNNSGSLAEKFYLEKYKLEVTPADWTFYMTALIYFWQSIWITYGVTMICRKTVYGYMYRAFPVLPPILYVVFSFALACNISWLLIWDREYMEVALVFINLMTCNLYICLVVSLRRLNDYGTLMVRQKLQRDIWLMRVLVHNGLAMFATWGTVAAMFNFAVVLTYRTGAKAEVGSTVSLAIFTLEIIAWWIFDNFVFERLLRYLFTPYIVILVSIAGILSKNWNPHSANSMLTLSLFGLVAVLSIIKTVLVLYRHFKRPLFSVQPKYRRPVVSFEVRSLLEQQQS